MKKNLNILTYFLIFFLMIATIYSSGLLSDKKYISRRDVMFEKAKVLEVLGENLNQDRTIANMYLGHQQLEIEILTGKYAGEKHIVRNAMGRTYNVHAEKNMEVIVSIFDEGNTITSLQVYSHKRSHVVFGLLGIFLLVIIAIGKGKGVKSIISLIFTGVMIVFFMIPRILEGSNPILIAIITAILSIVVTFYMISGWSKKTMVAAIGTVAGITIAGSISYWAGKIAYLSGLTMEHAEQLMYIADDTNMQIRGLMFIGILIASLGAIMDVGMSITSAAFEMDRINEKLTKKQLFESAMNVGRDIIGTMTNTLILAFTGGFLNMMLILTAYRIPYYQLMNLDVIAIELIQAIAGSIGIVLTVPITAAAATFIIKETNKKGNKRNIIKTL